MVNCRYTLTIETIFRIIVSANQLSPYGAVAEICEEYESLHERMGRPVVIGQSIVLSASKKISEGQNSSKRQTVFFMPVDILWTKVTKILR